MWHLASLCGHKGLVHHALNMTMNNLFTRFEQRITAVGGECHVLANVDEAARFIAAHRALGIGQKEIVVPPAFSQREPWGAIVPFLQEEHIHVREAGSPSSVADAPVGLSNAELAVAETGSVMLAENSLEARSVSMLTLTHFILVRAGDLFPMLDEAGSRLQQLTKAGPDQRRYISLVTGPSRTADIERTLTIGVQGPKEVCVLFIQDRNA